MTNEDRVKKYLTVVPVNFVYRVISLSTHLSWLNSTEDSSFCHEGGSPILRAISSYACISGSEWHFVEFVLPPGAKFDKMLLKSARNSKGGFNV